MPGRYSHSKTTVGVIGRRRRLYSELHRCFQNTTVGRASTPDFLRTRPLSGLEARPTAAAARPAPGERAIPEAGRGTRRLV